MTPVPEPARDDTGILTSLEERVLRAVEIVGALRAENMGLRQKLQSALEGQAMAEHALANASSGAEHWKQEIAQLRSERLEVRARIEKLLGQMETLSGG